MSERGQGQLCELGDTPGANIRQAEWNTSAAAQSKESAAKGLLEDNAHGMSCAAHYLAAMMSFLAACHL